LRQHVWSLSVAAFEAWLSYTCSESCWRTSTEKNTCGIARFLCGSTAFLYDVRLSLLIKHHLLTYLLTTFIFVVLTLKQIFFKQKGASPASATEEAMVDLCLSSADCSYVYKRCAQIVRSVAIDE